MTERNIPFGRPMVDQHERDAVMRVLEGTTFVHGPVTHEFEATFAERAGAKHAVSLGSCTAGLHLSLLVQGIGPGHRVAVPAMTHVATAHAVSYCGATPVFIDVERDTGNMDPAKLEEAAGGGLDAIMVVHYLGLPCDMAAIDSIAEKAKAFIVEDCALALDATFGGAKVGTLGSAGCFSFYPVKHMTTIEGGMLTTNDDFLADKVRQHKAFGYDKSLEKRARPGIYDVSALGYNYRMNEVEAAVGLAQLKKMDGFQSARTANFAALKVILDGIDGLTVFADEKGQAKSTHYCLNAILPEDGSVSRDDLVQGLKARGVGSSVHYPSAVPLFTYYREKHGFREGQFPVAEWLAAQTISLPVGPHMTTEDAVYVGENFATAYQNAKKQ